MDVRAGGKYRLVFGFGPQTMEFFGRYLEVTPCSRLSWTNTDGTTEAWDQLEDLVATLPR